MGPGPPLVADSRVTRVGLVAAAAAVLLSLATAPLGEPARTTLAAMVTLVLLAAGVPHGALDHLVLLGTRPGGTRRRGPLAGPRASFVVPYVALALVALAGYLAAPRVGFALFLALSVVHFAAGEAGVAVERGLARSWRDPRAWAASVGGSVVVVLPLASPEAGAALGAVDGRLDPVLRPLPALALGLTAVAVAALAACAVARLRGDRAAGVVGAEVAALLALAVLAHPLLAFGAFFAAWHSLRHQARLAQLLRGPTGAPRPGCEGRPVREVLVSARLGLPATAGVLAVAVLLRSTGASALGGLLAVVWALTVPHAVAVAWLEAHAGRRATAREPSGPSGASNGHDTDPPARPRAPGRSPAPGPAAPHGVRHG
ncbi:Brp/Blh family beta-carotene 15,15'-dioxygenase [Aquipuribacter sp. SD81]|uniref:Brp/Blh family beta-carotene 15,15'-dioxygenase n=1 Tax=Aquipuribacter sp. SD81 TaxID=3127703 RepID=UPI003017793F